MPNIEWNAYKQNGLMEQTIKEDKKRELNLPHRTKPELQR